MMAPAPAALERARAAWGAEMPEWVRVLAEACDASSQAKVAARLKYSGAAISQVLRRLYQADLSTIETAVRAQLMATSVDCPVLGPLPLADCQHHQAQPYTNTSPLAIELYRACRGGCANAKGE